MRLARINYGAQTLREAKAESEADIMSDKKTRKQESFSGHESTQTSQACITFYYPDYTVGLGITTSHPGSARVLFH